MPWPGYTNQMLFLLCGRTANRNGEIERRLIKLNAKLAMQDRNTWRHRHVHRRERNDSPAGKRKLMSLKMFA